MKKIICISILMFVMVMSFAYGYPNTLNLLLSQFKEELQTVEIVTNQVNQLPYSFPLHTGIIACVADDYIIIKESSGNVIIAISNIVEVTVK